MELINQIYCASSGATVTNTGVPSCVFTPDVVLDAILVPTGTTVTQAEINLAGGLPQLIMSKLNEDDKRKRWFYVPNFEELNDGSEDEQTESLGYGREVITGEGRYVLNFRFIKGGKCLHTKLRKFTGAEDAYDVFFIDGQRALMGTETVDTNGDIAISGYGLDEIFVPKMQFADGSNSAQFWIRFVLTDATQVNDTFAFVLPEGSQKVAMSKLKSIMDVTLIAPKTTNDGKVGVLAVSGCNAVNLAEVFGSDLADVSLWEVKSAGGTIAITAILETTNTIGQPIYELEIDTSDGNYPASTETFTISLVAPSVLETNDIVSPEGALFESNVIRVEVA